jgi:hypothetical protein
MVSVGGCWLSLCRWQTVGGKVYSPDNKLYLYAARILAKNIAHGWLPKVLDAFEKEHGRDAAVKLGKELGLCPWKLS